MLVFFLLASNVVQTPNYYSSILGNEAYGHLTDIPGAQSNVESKSIGNYVVLFQTSPSPVQAGDNSTLLRFSIIQDNQDTYNVFAALIVKEKSSGKVDAQFPYKFYESGDIDFRYTFDNTADHQVILQGRISGDQQYQNNPLVASFDVPVISVEAVKIVQIVVVLTLIALPVGVLILILDFNKRMKKESTSK